MSLDDFIQKCDQLLQTLETEMPAISDEIALNALAMVKNRIIDQREGIEGASYSTKPMLATKDQFVVKSAFKQSKVEETRFHRDKAGKIKAKAGNEKKVVKKGLWIKFDKASKAVPVMVLEHGYREFREIQGRPGDHVNGSLTGKMWQGTTIVGRSKKGFVWLTIIGGNNKEAQDKLSWLTLKFGEFLAVEPDENEKLAKVGEARIQSIYNRIFQ